MNAPAPIGERDLQRPIAVHNRMWDLYVFEGRSSDATATILNKEFKVRETRGSVVSYAHRQQWGKAQRNGLPTASPTPFAAPIPKLNKGPLPELNLLPPPPPPKPGSVFGGVRSSNRGPAPEPRPLERKIEPVALLEYDPESYEPRFLSELHHTQCKWPIGYSEGEHVFCGKRRLEGEPYCQPHLSRAYPNGKPKKR